MIGQFKGRQKTNVYGWVSDLAVARSGFNQIDRQTDRQTIIITEKAKTIYPLYTLYHGYEIFDRNFHIERKKNEQIKGLISNMWLFSCYTIQLITIKLCTKFQNPNPSSC